MQCGSPGGRHPAYSAYGSLSWAQFWLWGFRQVTTPFQASVSPPEVWAHHPLTQKAVLGLKGVHVSPGEAGHLSAPSLPRVGYLVHPHCLAPGPSSSPQLIHCQLLSPFPASPSRKVEAGPWMRLRFHWEFDWGGAVREFLEETLPTPHTDPSPNPNPEDLCKSTVLVGVQPQGQKLNPPKAHGLGKNLQSSARLTHHLLGREAAAVPTRAPLPVKAWATCLPPPWMSHPGPPHLADGSEGPHRRSRAPGPSRPHPVPIRRPAGSSLSRGKAEPPNCPLPTGSQR